MGIYSKTWCIIKKKIIYYGYGCLRNYCKYFYNIKSKFRNISSLVDSYPESSFSYSDTYVQGAQTLLADGSIQSLRPADKSIQLL